MRIRVIPECTGEHRRGTESLEIHTGEIQESTGDSGDWRSTGEPVNGVKGESGQSLMMHTHNTGDEQEGTIEDLYWRCIPGMYTGDIHWS